MIGSKNNKNKMGLVLMLASAGSAQAFEYQWNEHDFKVGTRARVAHVESDENARAASWLVRFSVESQWTEQLNTLLEVDHVELAWEDEFTNGVNLNGKPVIPDVEGTDLNQAYIRYAPTNRLELIVGREAIELGNQRFVGTNNFWQNEQTYDTAGFAIDFGAGSRLTYRYVDNVNRINGDDANADNGQRPAKFLGDHEHDTHLVFASFKEWDFSEFQAYYFDMDIEDALAMSNETLGLRYEYKGRLGKWRTLAFAEAAVQERSEVNERANLDYQYVGAGLGYRSSELSLHFERLGEDDGIAFVTPLSSLHDRNGWGDKFLITPGSGLQDYFIKYIWRKSPLKIDVRYHYYLADDDRRVLGEEYDVDFKINLAKTHSLLFRFADFNALDPGYRNEQRMFLMYRHDL